MNAAAPQKAIESAHEKQSRGRVASLCLALWLLVAFVPLSLWASPSSLAQTRIRAIEHKEPMVSGAEARQVQKYSGELWSFDDISHWHNVFGQRFYDPKTGIWLSVDPLFTDTPGEAVGRPLVMSLYAYANHSPMRFIDPDGRMPCAIPVVGWWACAEAAAIAAAGAATVAGIAWYGLKSLAKPKTKTFTELVRNPKTDPKIDPKPDPEPDPLPRWPPPYTQELPDEKTGKPINIALAFKHVLFKFANQVDAVPYTKWMYKGLVDDDTKSFAIQLMLAAETTVASGGKIKFNVQDIDVEGVIKAVKKHSSHYAALEKKGYNVDRMGAYRNYENKILLG